MKKKLISVLVILALVFAVTVTIANPFTNPIVPCGDEDDPGHSDNGLPTVEAFV